jgi:hypothetical protein
MIATAKREFINLQAPYLPFAYCPGAALYNAAHFATLMEIPDWKKLPLQAGSVLFPSATGLRRYNLICLLAGQIFPSEFIIPNFK